MAPPVIHFGAVARGETRARTFSITNKGENPSTFSVIRVFGFSLFTWNYATFLDACPLTGPGAGVFLSPGDTCSLTVIAQPTHHAPGRYEGADMTLGTLLEINVRVPFTLIVR